MPRMNGGVVGKYNDPSYYQTRGVWGMGDVDSSRRVGEWPQALSTTVVAVGHATLPYITVYEYSDVTGFGAKYTNPASPAAGVQTNGISFSLDGSNVALAHNTAPNVTVYPWSSSGFGTKYANPAAFPGLATEVDFHVSGDSVAVGTTTTPYTHAYAFSSAGFGTKYANPATLLIGAIRGLKFSPTGSSIGVSYLRNIINMAGYPWSNDTGFGAKYADPASGGGSAGTDLAFTPNGAVIAAGAVTGEMQTFPWNPVTGFGTRYANPATSVGGSQSALAFDRSGAYLAITHANGLNLGIYEWNDITGWGGRQTTLDPGPIGTGVEFSPSNLSLALCSDASAFVRASPWTPAGGQGSYFAAPATAPTGLCYSITFTQVSS